MENKLMNVAVMNGIGKMGYVKRPIPQIKEDEVLIKVAYVGICGSDLHYYESGAIGNYIVEPPFVLGHEASGIVVEVGSKVTNLKVGDKVTMEPGITCGECEFCKKGEYNLCPDVKFFATPPYDGTFQEYVAHPSNLTFKLPDSISLKEGAMVEPLSVGMHGAIQGDAKAGQTAVVFGLGAIGLLTMMAAKFRGVNNIIVVDIMENRLNKAKELGATHVINGLKEDVIKRICEITKGQMADIAFETAGTEITTNQCIHAVKKGSNIVLIGYSKTGKMNLEMSLALDKEVTFKTVFRYRHIYPLSIEAIQSGKVNVKDLISHEFNFNDIQKAMDDSINNKNEIVKSVIKVMEE